MAKRGSIEWKENIRKGVSSSWKEGAYSNADFSKSDAQKRKISESRKGKTYEEIYGEEKGKAMREIQLKQLNTNNPNLGKKHPNLNKGKKYALGTHWPEEAKERLKQKFRDFPETHPNRRMATLRFGQSKPQYELFLLIKEEFPEAELEYPIKTNHSMRFADIALPSKKIDIEFDGAYWHLNKQLDDIRTKHLNEIGWRVIRFTKDNVKLCIPTLHSSRALENYNERENTSCNQERNIATQERG